MEWFKIYKMPDGKPANEFAFNAEPKNKEFAEKIIAGTHDSWKRMVSGQSEGGGLAASNTTLANQFSLDQEAAAGIMAEVSNSCSYNTIANFFISRPPSLARSILCLTTSTSGTTSASSDTREPNITMTSSITYWNLSSNKCILLNSSKNKNSICILIKSVFHT